MQQNERHDLVHRHRLAVVANRAKPVRVAIRRQTDERPQLANALFERCEVTINRFRRDAAEERITRRADRLDFECAALQKTFDPPPACAVHRINDDACPCAAESFKIDVGRKLCAITFD